MRLGALLLGLVACSPPDRRPDLLLLTLDTTRADAVGAYGATPSPTPHLDRLAAGGLRVAEAMTVTPLTLPAHTSMLSGLYPDRHGVRDNGRHLPDDLALVPEALAAAGWQTGASVGAVVLDGGLGLERGFDHYADGFDLTALEGLHDDGATRRAGEVVARARAWLDEADGDAPVFLWVHVYDPHRPLSPRAEHLARLGDPYRAEIATADGALGPLVEAFAARSDRPEAVLVAGDHGEGLGEHGEETHGHLVYRSTMRVPLFLAAPGLGARVAPGPASVVDVGPTLLDLAGLPTPAALDGRSLLDGAADDPARVVYGETWHARHALGLAPLQVWQDGAERYVRAPRDELYRWVEDPGEQRDRAGSDDASLDRWRARAEAWRAARPPPLAPSAGVDPATRAALARLGYLHGAPASDDTPLSELPDPKDHPGLLAEVDQVIDAARRRPPAEAVPLLRAFSEAHPGVRVVRVLLARALGLSGEHRAALEIDQALLAGTPDEPTLLAHAAEQHLALGESEPALALLERALAAVPGEAGLVALRAEVLRRLDRCPEALPDLDAVLDAHPEASRARLVRGACRHRLGHLEAARADLEAVLRDDPDNADAPLLLGRVDLARGAAAEALPHLRAHRARHPDTPVGRVDLGLALLATGEVDAALAHLQGEEPRAVLARIEVALARQDLADARRDANLAIARWPERPEVHRAHAAVLVAEGRSEEAVRAMERARARSVGGGAPPGSDPWARGVP